GQNIRDGATDLPRKGVQTARMLLPLRELCGYVVEPRAVGQGVWAEGFQGAFVLVVQQCAVQAQRARLRRIDEARGVVRTHLEDDPDFEFRQRLAADEAADVV